MNFAAFDLNLLRVFDALVREQSVTRAGQRIGLSQSAMSAALNRLRAITEDPLFVRRGSQMKPTGRALAMAGPVRQSLEQIEIALAGEFLPSAAKRTYRIACTDLGASVIAPKLGARLWHEAPQIDLVVVHEDEQRALGLLDAGDVDIAIGVYPEVPNTLDYMRLYDAPRVCAMRSKHKLARRPLTLQALVDASHVAVSQGGDARYLAEVFARHGLRRRIAMTVPHFLIVPFILARIDLIAVVPLTAIQLFRSVLDLHVAPLPFEMSVRVDMVWSRAMTNDAGHAWIRSLVMEIAREHRPVEKRAPKTSRHAAI